MKINALSGNGLSAIGGFPKSRQRKHLNLLQPEPHPAQFIKNESALMLMIHKNFLS